MVLATEGAQLLTSQPLLCSTHSVRLVPRVVAKIRQYVQTISCPFSNNPTDHHQGAAQQTHSKDNFVLVQKFLFFGQSTVDNVGEVRLEANMEVSQNGQKLIPEVITIVYPEVLESLQELHQEEPKDSHCEPSVTGTRVNVVREV